MRCSLTVLQTRLSLQRSDGNVGGVGLSEKPSLSLKEMQEELIFASKGESILRMSLYSLDMFISHLGYES